MRVVCFTQFYLPELGGMQVSNSLLVQGLREKGVEVELHVFGRQKRTLEGHLYRQFDYNFSPISLLGHLKVIFLILKVVRKTYPDMVLLLDESPVRALGLLPFKLRLPSRLVSINSGSTLTRYNFHMKGKLNAMLVRRGYHWLHRIFVAEATAVNIKRLFPDLAIKVRVLGRPIPPNFFMYEPSYFDWPPESGLPLFMSSGRASEDKGVDLILGALSRLKNKYGKEVLEYWCVGAGPCLTEWKNLAKRHSLEKVRFMGGVPFDDLPLLYSKASFFVLPSTGEMETFGRVWVEAMALGKPVVSTNLDNLKNLVTDGKNGFLVDPNAESICDGIERCLGLSTEQYNEFAKNSLETAKKYRVENIVDDLLLMLN